MKEHVQVQKVLHNNGVNWVDMTECITKLIAMVCVRCYIAIWGEYFVFMFEFILSLKHANTFAS